MKMRNLFIVLGVAGMATVNVMAGGLMSPKAADSQVKTVNGYDPEPSLTATGLKSAPPRVVDSKEKIVPGKSVEVTPWMKNSKHMSGSPKMIGERANSAADTTASCCAPAPAVIK